MVQRLPGYAEREIADTLITVDDRRLEQEILAFRVAVARIGVAPALLAPAISRKAEWVSWRQPEASAADAAAIGAATKIAAAIAAATAVRKFSMPLGLNGKSMSGH